MNESLSHDQLPLPDYDHIPLGNLEARITALDRPQLDQLLRYEREHGNRLPVVNILERRAAALESGAEPGGSVPERLPEVSQGHGGSKVTPATAGPPQNPPFEGVPGNPSRPR